MLSHPVADTIRAGLQITLGYNAARCRPGIGKHPGVARSQSLPRATRRAAPGDFSCSRAGAFGRGFYGEVAERLNAAVSKTVNGLAPFGGSNPSLSAIQIAQPILMAAAVPVSS